MGVQEDSSLGSPSGSPAIATPSLVGVRTKESVAADTNMSAIGSPPESLAYRRSSLILLAGLLLTGDRPDPALSTKTVPYSIYIWDIYPAIPDTLKYA